MADSDASKDMQLDKGGNPPVPSPAINKPRPSGSGSSSDQKTDSGSKKSS